ncbi:MAG TPA: PilZ domain-containing protein [Candidatus Methylomirabilis sp.]|nr:PilZ domain-containing protein [Candidatus Methylomirabilis sp.]
MVETPNRRRAARVTVPAHLGPFELELRLAQLLDLSAEGVRIEHLGHLHEGLRLFIDLPPDLGGGRLTGEVVWTRLRKGEQTLEGDRFVYYQSGIAFIGITPEQQAALAVALAILKRDERPAGA